jgi:hypothetical protein
MVKVRGKKVTLTPSEYVLKDLVGPKGKRRAKSLKALEVEAAAEAARIAKEQSEVHLPETRASDEVHKPTVRRD